MHQGAQGRQEQVQVHDSVKVTEQVTRWVQSCVAETAAQGGQERWVGGRGRGAHPAPLWLFLPAKEGQGESQEHNSPCLQPAAPASALGQANAPHHKFLFPLFISQPLGHQWSFLGLLAGAAAGAALGAPRLGAVALPSVSFRGVRSSGSVVGPDKPVRAFPWLVGDARKLNSGL